MVIYHCYRFDCQAGQSAVFNNWKSIYWFRWAILFVLVVSNGKWNAYVNNRGAVVTKKMPESGAAAATTCFVTCLFSSVVVWLIGFFVFFLHVVCFLLIVAHSGVIFCLRMYLKSGVTQLATHVVWSFGPCNPRRFDLYSRSNRTAIPGPTFHWPNISA